jgi:hypothetical protein
MKLIEFAWVLKIMLTLAAGFLSITFLQSGLDKLINYKDNYSWLAGQFSKTFLRHTIVLLLPVLTIMELLSGLLTAGGAVLLWLSKGTNPLCYGFALTGLTMLMLLFGQRVSKQYDGAAALTGYFLIVLVGLIGIAFVS